MPGWDLVGSVSSIPRGAAPPANPVDGQLWADTTTIATDGEGEIAYVELATGYNQWQTASIHFPDTVAHDIPGLTVTFTGGVKPAAVRFKFICSVGIGLAASGSNMRLNAYLLQANTDGSFTTVEQDVVEILNLTGAASQWWTAKGQYRFQPVPGTVYSFKVQFASTVGQVDPYIFGANQGVRSYIEAMQR